MRLVLNVLIILVFVAHFCKANMASPLEEGTMASSAISSKDINILSESIDIKIDSDFKTARFLVEYQIQSDMDGLQIPLLFFAQDYKDGFFIWVDNKKAHVQNVPERYSEYSPFRGFSESFEKNDTGGEITIYWQSNAGYVYKLSDLKYFEADIGKGIHTVRVEYIANVWTDYSDWIKAYSFRYSLSPAKFWKSFGTLSVTLEQEGIERQLSTNLGEPLEKAFQSTNSWTFTNLPGEYLEFSYNPKPGKFAAVLISVQPLGLAIATGIVLFALHLFLVIRYRRKFATKKYSSVVIAGSFLVPFLFLVSYSCSYPLIDFLIGEEAGKNHGYVFLIFAMYPVLALAYGMIMWLLDRLQKRKINSGS